MSRIGKIPVVVPSQVQVRLEGVVLKAKGPQGELQEIIPPGIKAEIKDGKIILTADQISSGPVRAIYGTTRARVANLIHGTHAGFVKVLDIVGLGFKAQLQGEKLILNLGKSHPVEYVIPKGLKMTVDPKNTQITVSGPSRELVGSTAAVIRAIRPPEPYKGTGIRYQGEHIIRKAGKTAAGAAGAGAAGGGKK